VESEQSCALEEGLPTQQLLWFHWLRCRERLRALASSSENRPPLNQQTEFSAEQLRQAEAFLEGWELLTARMRRIENYLDSQRKRSASEALSTLELAKTIRANIQRGDTDEAIAFFLERWKTPEKKRGRPKGSNDPENVTVLALQLHESNPKLWTWPKIADQLLNCKLHVAHEADSNCAVNLRQAVSQLKKFLKEMQSD